MQNQFVITERDIFADQLSESEIKKLLTYTDVDYIFAKRSPSIKKMNLDVSTMSEDEKIGAMIREPRLIRRPLVFYEGRVLTGADVKKLT